VIRSPSAANNRIHIRLARIPPLFGFQRDALPSLRPGDVDTADLIRSNRLATLERHSLPKNTTRERLLPQKSSVLLLSLRTTTAG
jgi:hypothetical protein